MEISQAYLMRVGNTGYGSGWQICAKTPNASIHALNRFETQQSLDIDKFEIKRRAIQNDNIDSQICMYSSFGDIFLVKKECIGVDGTGRTNYSVHGFIIDEQNSDEVYSDVASAIASMPFKTYSDDVKNSMSESVAIAKINIEPKKILAQYNISISTFVKLMQSVYGCIYSNNKQPLVINLENLYSEKAAIDIMSIIYMFLPIQLRKKVSFSSYYVHDASYYDICFTNENLNTYNNFNLVTGVSTGESNNDDIINIVNDILSLGKKDVIDNISKALESCEDYIDDYHLLIEVCSRWCFRKDFTIESVSSDIIKLCRLNYKDVKAISVLLDGICTYVKQKKLLLDPTTLAVFANFEKRYRDDKMSSIYHKYLGYHVAMTETYDNFQIISEYEILSPEIFKTILDEIKKYGNFQLFVDHYYIDYKLKALSNSDMDGMKQIYADLRTKSGSDRALQAKAAEIVKSKMLEYINSYKTYMSEMDYNHIFDFAKSFGFANSVEFKTELLNCYWKNFSFKFFNQDDAGFYSSIICDDVKSLLVNAIIKLMCVKQQDAESLKINSKIFNERLAAYSKTNKNKAEHKYLSIAIKNLMPLSDNKLYVYVYISPESYKYIYYNYEKGDVDFYEIMQHLKKNIDIKHADKKFAGIFSNIAANIDKKEKKILTDYIVECNRTQQRNDIFVQSYIALTGKNLPSNGENNIWMNILHTSLSVLMAVFIGMCSSAFKDNTVYNYVSVGVFLAGCLFLIVFNLVDIKHNPKNFIGSVLYAIVSVAILCALSFIELTVASLIIACVLWIICLAAVIVATVNFIRDNG